MGRDTAGLLAGGAAAAVLPILALALNLPVWLSGAVAIGVFAGVWFLARSGASAAIDNEALLAARNDTVRALIADGSAALARLKQVAPAIGDGAMRAEVMRLVKTTDQVLADMRGDAARAMAVRRLFTFYLPNAVEVAEGWQTLERHANPSPERIRQTRETMRDLNAAFIQYAEEADAPEMREFDTTLKLLNDSLKSDLEKTP